MNQNHSENVQQTLKDGEESFQCTINEYNETKAALTIICHEESTWRQLLCQKQSILNERQNKLSINRELLLESIDKFSNTIEKCFQNSILDNFIEQLSVTDQQMKSISKTSTQTIPSKADNEIDELKKKLKRIDAEINLYDNNNDARNQINSTNKNYDGGEEFQIIKRLQDATKNVLENVSKADGQIKILENLIAKKKNNLNAKSNVEENMYMDMDSCNNAQEVPENEFLNSFTDNSFIEMDTAENNFTINLSVNDHRFNYESTVNNDNNLIEPIDYLYTSSGIDNQIRDALDTDGNRYQEFSSYDDDNFDMVEMNCFDDDNNGNFVTDAPEINESAAMTSEFVTARSLFLSEPAEKVSGSIKSSKFVYKKPHE